MYIIKKDTFEKLSKEDQKLVEGNNKYIDDESYDEDETEIEMDDDGITTDFEEADKKGMQMIIALSKEKPKKGNKSE